MPILQRIVTSKHFSELQSFAEHNTLAPDVWEAASLCMSHVVNALTGEWIDPATMIPGRVDIEAVRRAREQIAERKLDRMAGAD